MLTVSATQLWYWLLWYLIGEACIWVVSEQGLSEMHQQWMASLVCV